MAVTIMLGLAFGTVLTMILLAVPFLDSHPICVTDAFLPRFDLLAHGPLEVKPIRGTVPVSGWTSI